MTNQTLPTDSNNHQQISFGLRLTSCREALGLDRKEAAAQLRLSEKVIVMLEDGEIANNLPLTFVRGYVRSYGKLLAIPEQEIQDMFTLLTHAAW